MTEKGEKMQTEKEIQTAWEIYVLINWLSDLLRERYENDFADRGSPPPEDDPFLGPLGPLGLIDPPDKKETDPPG
jgi:hypothetical protein